MAHHLGPAGNEVLGSCYNCGRELREAEYSRQEICPGCRMDTKVCRNCLHYDPRMNNECREPAADQVTDKVKSNFCDWFKPATPKAEGGKKKEDPKAAFDRLFKKP